MSCGLQAYRDADLKLSYVFPEGTSFTGYDASFVVYEEKGGAAILTVGDIPTANDSQITFSVNVMTLLVKADDIDALPENADASYPSILYFDLFLTNSEGLTSKIQGGAFRVMPLGAPVCDDGGDIQVSLDGSTFGITILSGPSYNFDATASAFGSALVQADDASDARDILGVTALLTNKADVDLGNVTSANFGAKLFQGTSLLALRSGADRVRDLPSLLEFYSSPSSTVADAMQAAIDWMETSKIPVRLPAGQIVLNKNLQIKSNTHFVGAGRDSSTVFLPANIDMTGAPSYGGDQRAVWNNPSISNVIFDGFSFQGPGTGNTKIVNVGLRNVTNFLARDCGWRDIGDATWFATGIILFESTGVTFDSCLFDNCKGDGGAVGSASRNVLIKNCWITNNRDWGFALSIDVDNALFEGNYVANNLSTGIGADRCENVSFIGNRCFNNEHGIRIAKFAIPGDTQRQIIVQGNICVGNLQGVTVEGSDAPCVTIIEGNTVIATTNEAILLADVQGAIVCGNSLYNNSADNIAIRGYTLPCGGHVIDDNKIVGGTRGIYEAASGAGSILPSKIGHSNSIEGIATANTYVLTASVDQQGEPLTRSFGGFRGSEALRAVYGSGKVNWVEVYGSATGLPVQIRAVGADANVGLQLAWNGTGGGIQLVSDVSVTPVEVQRFTATAHFIRTPGGALVQVVGARNTGWTAMTGTASKGALATYTAPTISATYTPSEVQGIADALQALSRRMKALDDALQAATGHGLIGT